MQAIVLAGGLGTRLRPLTAKVPKAMVPIKDKPFLLHLIEMLKGKGIRDIILSIGYLGHVIVDYFGNGSRWGISIRYSNENSRLLGTGGALKHAYHLLDQHFFVINGDTYLPINYDEMERDYYQRGNRPLIAAYQAVNDSEIVNNLTVTEDLKVQSYDKSGSSINSNYTDAGVLILSRLYVEEIKENQIISIEDSVYLNLIEKQLLEAHIVKTRFYDIGTPERNNIFTIYLDTGKL